jgi:ADP-ribosylglycohydrolase
MTTTAGETISVQQRFLNVVIAARVGDAMGTPTEGLTAAEISEQFGWVSTFQGDGTDDSLMADILTRVLAHSQGMAGADLWAGQLVQDRAQILDKRDYFFASVLHLLEKLRRGYRPGEVALGNMPSSSSAMCIWPVSLVNAANPDNAAKQAYDLASLIQVAPVDHCADAAAGLAAAIAAAFLPGADIESCVDHARRCIRPTSGRPFRDTLSEAADLARQCGSYESFRDDYQARFSQPILCDALETVPAAFGLSILAAGDVKKAVEYGANFGRDSDTIACMAGALTGALATEVPYEWIDSLDEADLAEAKKSAAELVETAVLRSRIEHERALATTAFLGRQ